MRKGERKFWYFNPKKKGGKLFDHHKIPLKVNGYLPKLVHAWCIYTLKQRLICPQFRQLNNLNSFTDDLHNPPSLLPVQYKH